MGLLDTLAKTSLGVAFPLYWQSGTVYPVR